MFQDKKYDNISLIYPKPETTAKINNDLISSLIWREGKYGIFRRNSSDFASLELCKIRKYSDYKVTNERGAKIEQSPKEKLKELPCEPIMRANAFMHWDNNSTSFYPFKVNGIGHGEMEPKKFQKKLELAAKFAGFVEQVNNDFSERFGEYEKME